MGAFSDLFSLGFSIGDCCCGDSTYVGCYCPTVVPSCVAGLTHEEIAALEVYPYEFDDSQNKDCSDLATTTYRCIGRANPAAYSACYTEPQCPPSGSIVFTGSEKGTTDLNCNQYISFGMRGKGRCDGYVMPEDTFTGTLCSTYEAECQSYANEEFRVEWTAGTCNEVYSVEIETITSGESFETICAARNCCQDNDRLNPKLCGCVSWRIVEIGPGNYSQGYAVQYQSSETLCNVPENFTPTSYGYTGYMQLQFSFNGEDFVPAESWTTINGGPTHTLGTYGSECIDCTEGIYEIEYGEKL